jgi:hypothetical protein
MRRCLRNCLPIRDLVFGSCCESARRIQSAEVPSDQLRVGVVDIDAGRAVAVLAGVVGLEQELKQPVVKLPNPADLNALLKYGLFRAVYSVIMSNSYPALSCR